MIWKSKMMSYREVTTYKLKKKMYRSYKIYKFLTALCPLAYSPLPTHLSFIKDALRSPSWPFLFDTRINVSLCLLSPTPPPKSFIQTIQVEKKNKESSLEGSKVHTMWLWGTKLGSPVPTGKLGFAVVSESSVLGGWGQADSRGLMTIQSESNGEL